MARKNVVNCGTLGIDDYYNKHVLADANGRLHAVTAVGSSGNQPLNYYYSDNNGDSWSSAINISELGNDNLGQSSMLVCDDGTVHFVWTQLGIAPVTTKYTLCYRTIKNEVKSDLVTYQFSADTNNLIGGRKFLYKDNEGTIHIIVACQGLPADPSNSYPAEFIVNEAGELEFVGFILNGPHKGFNLAGTVDVNGKVFLVVLSTGGGSNTGYSRPKLFTNENGEWVYVGILHDIAYNFGSIDLATDENGNVYVISCTSYSAYLYKYENGEWAAVETVLSTASYYMQSVGICLAFDGSFHVEIDIKSGSYTEVAVYRRNGAGDYTQLEITSSSNYNKSGSGCNQPLNHNSYRYSQPGTGYLFGLKYVSFSSRYQSIFISSDFTVRESVPSVESLSASKNVRTGYHAFLNQALKNQRAGLPVLKTPDGEQF